MFDVYGAVRFIKKKQQRRYNAAFKFGHERAGVENSRGISKHVRRYPFENAREKHCREYRN